MSLYYVRKGQQAALEKLGFLAPLRSYSMGTNENPRGVPTRTNEDPKTQVNTGFDTFDSALNRDSAMESSQFSVGSGQSTTNKEGQLQERHVDVQRALHQFAKRKGVDHNDAVVIAGGALYLHGIRPHMNDVDAIIPGLSKKVKGRQNGFDMDVGPGGDLPKEALDYVEMGGLKVQSLPAALAFYKTLNRPKDQQWIQKLENRTKTSGQRTINKEGQLQDRMTFRNLQISVENKAGSFREWYDPNNDEHGKTKMLYPYGYVRMSEGMDGDHVDCFIGPNENADNVYVITTNKAPDFKVEDEQKCMLGFDSEKQARDIFAKHYTKAGFFRSIKTIPYTDFETKVLATKDAPRKKIAGALMEHIQGMSDGHTNVSNSPDTAPGDHLGLPRASLVGERSVKGDPMSPGDKISRGFRSMNDTTNTTSLDGPVDSASSIGPEG